ncbi:type I-F CRISPR-associated protein Csy3 [Vibrio sp. DNB22_19_1]
MELCNQLNYLRSLSPGKAYFYYLKGGEKCPLRVDKTRIRAPKSGYAEGFSNNEFAIIDSAPQDLAYSNPQFIEECYAPPNITEIYCSFSLRINANSLKPNVCSNESTRDVLVSLANQYKELGGYGEIAKRIAKNILMGTWVWRNRECRSLSIEVQTPEHQLKVENCFKLTWQGDWPDEVKGCLEQLASYIESALTDNKELYYMDVIAKLDIGSGDEIYPSQEFIDGKQEGVPSKQLAKAQLDGDKETAAFHAQKVGAALQTIDDWWHENADKPLRVNEYGADREYVIARRHPRQGNDFYQLVSRSEEWLEQMNDTRVVPDEVHFIMAVLVKANVFNNRKQ